MRLKIFIRSNLFVLLLLSGLLPAAVQARTTDLVNPDPVTLNCGLSPQKMQQAIESGGSVRDWTVVGQEPGNTQLRYIKGNNKHIITVDVRYTRNTFSVEYKDSVNLHYFVNYENVRRIHPRPVGWMKNLSSDINEAANALCR